MSSESMCPTNPGSICLTTYVTPVLSSSKYVRADR